MLDRHHRQGRKPDRSAVAALACGRSRRSAFRTGRCEPTAVAQIRAYPAKKTVQPRLAGTILTYAQTNRFSMDQFLTRPRQSARPPRSLATYTNSLLS